MTYEFATWNKDILSFFSKKHMELFLAEVAHVLSAELRLSTGTSILVGISGGPDSVALLHLLAASSLCFNLHGVYVDHCLRPAETPEEIRLVSELCRKLGVHLTVETANVPTFHSQYRHSPEEAARILRHKLLEKVRLRVNAAYIALAHTADDQVEEFLLRLSRGTGLTGLSGMQSMSGSLIRPLLKFHKRELLAYLETNNIPYCLDSSNLDRKYLRNSIRLDVIPELEQALQPSIRNKILQTMEILRTDDALISDLVRQKRQQCVTHQTEENSILPGTDGYFLELRPFSACHPSIQRRLIEHCCVLIKSKPNYAMIVRLLDDIAGERLAVEYHLPQGGRLLSVVGGLFFCRPRLANLREKTPDAPTISRIIDKPGVLAIEEAGRNLILAINDVSEKDVILSEPDVLQVDLEHVAFPLTLRSFQPGDRFTPCNRSGSRKIGRYLNDRNVPAREKNLWPVLISSMPNQEIIAIPGMTVADSCKVSDRTSKILIIRWEPIVRK